jgi:hypothetical protein
MQNKLNSQGLEKGNGCRTVPAASKKPDWCACVWIKQDVAACGGMFLYFSWYFFTKERTLL